MKKYSLKFAIYIFLCMFVVPKFTDCPFQTEKKQSHYNHISGKNLKSLAYAERVTPFDSFRYFGFGGLWHCVGFNFCLQTLILEKMPKSQEQRFERGEQFHCGLSPHQTTALAAMLTRTEASSLRATLHQFLIGWGMSDTCDAEVGIERSSHLYNFVLLDSFLLSIQKGGEEV